MAKIKLTGGLTGTKFEIDADDIQEVSVPKAPGFGSKVTALNRSALAGRRYQVAYYCKEHADKVLKMVQAAKEKGK